MIAAVALLVVGVAYLGFGLVDPLNFSQPAEPSEDPSDDRFIQPSENGTQLWPFTSRTESTTQRTLAINLLIKGPSHEVRTTLIDRTELGFEELPEDQEDAEEETYRLEVEPNNIDWDDAHGSTRYTFMQPDGGDGRWMDETYQLYSGDYLGHRSHIRAYDEPDGEWTALQIHEEYFDLFRLRHTVTGAQGPATTLEREFANQPFVEEMTRQHHGLFGGRSDGWLTVVDLGVLAIPWETLLFGLAIGSFISSTSRRALTDLAGNIAEWSRKNIGGYAMAAALIALVVGVRVVGLTLERNFPETTPQLFATILYPLLAVGPLLVALVFARKLTPLTAFGFATLGLAMAFTMDLGQIGLEVVPVRMVLHRVGLVFSLGLFALGIARRTSDEPDDEIDVERISLATLGAIAWFVGLALPLLDVI